MFFGAGHYQLQMFIAYVAWSFFLPMTLHTAGRRVGQALDENRNDRNE